MSFSVIVATRNRPQLFERALRSVVEQSFSDREIIVVDDGSSEENAARYRAIADAMGGQVRWHSLVTRPNGHGPSYALNFGVERANGTYLCFLDDDDWWTDPTHLQRAWAALADPDRKVDLYLSNQVAFLNDKQKPGPIWIEDLTAILKSRGRAAEPNGTYSVTVPDLLASHGFCHLNTLIVRRELFARLGGMDETIRWEGDRELYLRLIDHAKLMAYNPAVVSRHNIPDPTRTSNVTTAASELEKRLSQLRVLDRAQLFAEHAEIRTYARRHKAYVLKKIAERLDQMGRYAEAAFYAREALGAGPTVKWTGYATWLAARELVTVRR